MALFRAFFFVSSLTSIPKLTTPALRSATSLFPRRTMSTTTFKLDPAIFNASLYKKLTDTWLPGVDTSGNELDLDVIKIWFAGTPEERAAFDSTCRDNFAHALEAIGPDRISNHTAQPFLDEVERVKKEQNDTQAAWTALSLAILLDQIPRNLYRDDAGLRKVYNHYDKMSYALARALLSSSPRVDLHPQWRNSMAHRLWFYMALVHSEDVEAHDFLTGIIDEAKQELEQLEDGQATKMFLEKQVESEKEHRDILDRFGRYPHRNGALGRESTEEEKRFLEEGGATFGVVQKKMDE
ncbi:hypothetical protein DE146DRAFT_672437 [Phaeosphaeria sp. MPI-PUGE-AT-0046c]|nr:hypothetical protein DE146DRAFT_672437 [Phaeosphaeria sp. MPI-PUGE-AT-0046c]